MLVERKNKLALRVKVRMRMPSAKYKLWSQKSWIILRIMRRILLKLKRKILNTQSNKMCKRPLISEKSFEDFLNWLFLKCIQCYTWHSSKFSFLFAWNGKSMMFLQCSSVGTMDQFQHFGQSNIHCMKICKQRFQHFITKQFFLLVAFNFWCLLGTWGWKQRFRTGT